MPYHITPVENLDAILRDGLQPCIGPRSRDLGETEPAIYMFESREDIEAGMEWLLDAFDAEETPCALLWVDLPAEKQSPLDIEISWRAPVPAERISVLSLDIFNESEIPHAPVGPNRQDFECP